MQGKITYHRQPSFCGKPSCRKCREGEGHGPYWYAYSVVDGRTTRTYVGKELPPEAQAAYNAQIAREQPSATTNGTLGTVSPGLSPRASLQLADEYVAHGTLSNAISTLDRLLALDPANETAVYRLMVILAQSKRRGEALRVYQRFTEGVQRAHGTTPSPRLQALFEAIRQGDAVSYPEPQPPTDETHPPVEGTSNSKQVTSDAVQEHPIDGAQDTAPIQIGRSHQNPLIGREKELHALHMLLLDVERYAHTPPGGRRRPSALPLDTQRHSQCMLLIGDAGIGKTRLAEEVSREAQQRGWHVLWSRVYPQESGIPYRPWTEVLRSVLHRVGDGMMNGRAQESRTTGHGTTARGAIMREGQVIPSYVQSLVALVPELQAVVPAVGLAPHPLELEQLRLREAVRDTLIAASEHTPLVIVLDDIQWADVSSCELLGYLARHLYGYPIMFIGTCREHEITEYPLRPLIDHMQREHSVKTLHIEPLTNEQIALLVSHTPSLTKSLVQHIQTQAAGNPFFAEELARLMPPAPSTLPRTITAALDSRITRLSEPCQRLLGNAAILGVSFEYSAICAMESASSTTDEDMLLDLLDEALQAGVLSEEGIGSRISYAFWHPLLVTHLYERISATRRTRLHRRAAEVLQRLYASQEQEIAATITHHLVQGGADPAQIIHYAELAGHHAYILLAYPEAERHYRLAVEYIDKIGDKRVVEGLPVSLPDKPTLLERLAECTGIQGNFEGARSHYEHALRIRSQRTALASEADAHYEAQRQALLWGEIGRLWRYMGDTAQALACCERGEAVLRDVGVVTGPAWARLRYQVSSFYELEGRYEDARRASQEALALFEQALPMEMPDSKQRTPSTPPTRIERTLAGDPVNLGRTYALLGMLDYNVGLLAEALAHLNSALAIYEQYDQKREIAHVSCNIGHVHLKRGEHESAQAALRRSLSLAERIGDGPLTSVIFMNMGEIAAGRGKFPEAEEWYRKSLALAEHFNDRQYLSLWHTGLTSVLVAQGKLTEAATCIRQALQIGRAMQNAPCIGAALVALGTLRIAQMKAAAEQRSDIRSRLLLHARSDVQRALNLARLDAETRLKGQQVLTQVAQLLGDGEYQQA